VRPLGGSVVDDGVVVGVVVDVVGGGSCGAVLVVVLGSSGRVVVVGSSSKNVDVVVVLVVVVLMTGTPGGGAPGSSAWMGHQRPLPATQASALEVPASFGAQRSFKRVDVTPWALRAVMRREILGSPRVAAPSSVRHSPA